MQVKNLASPAMQTSKYALKPVQAQVLFAYQSTKLDHCKVIFYRIKIKESSDPGTV